LPPDLERIAAIGARYGMQILHPSQEGCALRRSKAELF
jgi:hypothetical protein